MHEENDQAATDSEVIIDYLKMFLGHWVTLVTFHGEYTKEHTGILKIVDRGIIVIDGSNHAEIMKANEIFLFRIKKQNDENAKKIEAILTEYGQDTESLIKKQERDQMKAHLDGIHFKLQEKGFQRGGPNYQ